MIRAAIALADREDVEAVSMRRLSQALGVVPMALYKHVGDKEDLLNGMVDAVVQGFSAAPVTSKGKADWRAEVRSRTLSARAALAEHPWMRRTLGSRTVRTAGVLGHMEAVTACLLRGGLSPDLAHHAMHALGNRIWGFSPELFDESRAASTPVRHTGPEPDPDDYPSILATTAAARGRRPEGAGCDEDFEFTFGLDLLLEGIDRLHQGGWSS